MRDFVSGGSKRNPWGGGSLLPGGVGLDNSLLSIIENPINGEFTPLGRTYSFDLKSESKATLEEKLTTLLSITDALQIQAQLKLKIPSS